MEDIRVYHSVWKNSLIILVCFLFVAVGMFLHSRGDNSWQVWGSILFFGVGGLFMSCLVLKERIAHKPYMIITEESIIMTQGKGVEVRFADVESFNLVGKRTATILINYKEHVAQRHMAQASSVGRVLLKFNEYVIGSSEMLLVSDLTISPKDLYGLLNERLIAYIRQH